MTLRDRSLVTVVSLMAQGLVDESFRYHLQSARANGITKEEIAEIVTHAGFYCGWPKAWAVFRMVKEVWNEESPADDAKAKHQASMIFPIGAPNDGFAQYFIGQSYLAPDSWFSHLTIEVPGENGSTEWLEPVDDGQYRKLKLR